MREFPVSKPLVSIVLSAYNEAGILLSKLSMLVSSIEAFKKEYLWEIILVNDGSSDDTGQLAETFAVDHPNIIVIHHEHNQGLGKGLQTGFSHSRGDYVITLDVDLSTSPSVIPTLLKKIQETNAKIVIASSMQKGCRMEGMPFYRRVLSRIANRFLAFFAPVKITSLTGMTRVYEGKFIRSIYPRSEGMEIMQEVIYKTVLLREQIEEIPCDLIWDRCENEKVARVSKMKIVRQTLVTLFSCFLFKPFLFFVIPGLLFLSFAFYSNGWMFLHYFEEYAALDHLEWLDRFSVALERSYGKYPHTFITALFSTLFSVQLLSIGLQSLQSKHYFEELFYLISKKGE